MKCAGLPHRGAMLMRPGLQRCFFVLIILLNERELSMKACEEISDIVLVLKERLVYSLTFSQPHFD